MQYRQFTLPAIAGDIQQRDPQGHPSHFVVRALPVVSEPLRLDAH
jgi:hypothetical protein